MSSVSENSNAAVNSEPPRNDENKEEATSENAETKNSNSLQTDNKSSTELFGKPVTICSPFSTQNSYKPVFGNHKSILKPSTLFSDANVSTPSVTFGNNTTKSVKLKPSVLANPFVNNEPDKKEEVNVDCDEKNEEVLPDDGDEAALSKDETAVISPSSSVSFVPLTTPVTANSTTSNTATNSVTTSSSPPAQTNETTSADASAVSTGFVFGQNLHERVTIENDKTQEDPVIQNGTTFSEMLFSSAIKQETTNNKQKENSVSHEFSNGNTKTLSDSAKEYEEARSVKRKYEEVAVVTGEEDEQNVLQINCKLFAFDNASSTWAERGRGTLRVNDKETSEGRNSRLVMRLLGNLRVVLNTKIWSDMSVDLASKKSVRLTAIDNDGQVRIYLVMASPKDSEQLYNVLTTRIQRKKLKVSTEESGGSTSSDNSTV